MITAAPDNDMFTILSLSPDPMHAELRGAALKRKEK